MEQQPETDIPGEVIRAVFEAIPWGYRIELPDGSGGTIEKFFKPEEKDDRWRFGFDVKLVTRSPEIPKFHFEFIVQYTGFCMECSIDQLPTELQELVFQVQQDRQSAKAVADAGEIK